MSTATHEDSVRCKECGAPTDIETEHWTKGWWPQVIDGVEHRHDPNRRTEYRMCRGEVMHIAYVRHYFVPCPACGWTAEVR